MSGWTVWGNPFDTSDLTSPVKSIRLKPNANIVCKAIRTWIIVYNDPAFTNLTMKVYADSVASESIAGLITTSSTTLTKSQIVTLENGVKEIYFEFDNLALQSGTFYHFVIQGTGYTGNASSHLAWRHAYPDPVYTEGLSVTYSSAGYMPYAGYIIGDEI